MDFPRPVQVPKVEINGRTYHQLTQGVEITPPAKTEKIVQSFGLVRGWRSGLQLQLGTKMAVSSPGCHDVFSMCNNSVCLLTSHLGPILDSYVLYKPQHYAENPTATVALHKERMTNNIKRETCHHPPPPPPTLYL